MHEKSMNARCTLRKKEERKWWNGQPATKPKDFNTYELILALGLHCLASKAKQF